MSVDVVGYLESVGADIIYSGENVGPNDVAMPCPWCDDPSYHLTIHRTKGYLNCWRCSFDEYRMRNRKGWAPSFKALIKEIENCTWKEVKKIWEDIGGDTADNEPWTKVERKEVCDLPSSCYQFSSPGPFSGIRDVAFSYLTSRGFTKYHVKKYNLHFTSAGYYKHRIIVPIYRDGKLVNWLGRRFHENVKGRYMNCRLADSTLRFAELLFGEDTFQGDVLRIVEGAFDKMRIGDTALSLNRSQFSRIQRNIISKLGRSSRFTSILLDPEAEHRAISIAEELSPFTPRIKVPALPAGKDPADMAFDDILAIESQTPYFEY